MRFLEAAEITGVQGRAVVARDLISITPRAFAGGGLVPFYFSTLVRTQDIAIVDGRTGATVTRTFRGVGGAFKVGNIPLTADVTVRTVTIELPAIDAIVEEMLRAHDVRGAPVQIHRLYLEPDTRAPLAAAKPRFVGFVDTAPIETPAAGNAGGARITCVSTTRELTRTGTDVRSHESQLARSAGADDFYIDTAVVADWELFWGKARAGGGIAQQGGGS